MDGTANSERRGSLHVENYGSSLTSPTRSSAAQGGSGGRNGQHVPVSAEQERDLFAEEYNKTVTLIFWYKANMEPLRIQQAVPNFPYFQLSRLGSLISDLGLGKSSYIDAYNPSSSQWEQHSTGTVRMVIGQQRLLYRMRKSLFEGLREDDCPGLIDELQRQTDQGQVESGVSAGQKRFASETLESPNPTKVHLPNGFYLHSMGNMQHQQQSTSSLPTPPAHDSTNASSSGLNQPDYGLYHPPLLHPPQIHPPQVQPHTYYNVPSLAGSSTVLPSHLSTPKAATTPIPYHPHPPLKRWPNDYTVYELTSGFNAMDALIAQTPAGQNMTQKVAFERVFGSRYVKSTVCRHRALWKKADPAIRQQFEALLNDDRAVWGEFVRRLEGRPSGKAGTNDPPPVESVIDYSQSQGSSSSGSVGGMSGSQDRREEGLKDALGQIGNQQQTIQHNPTMNNQNMNPNVYDPSLGHMNSSSSHI
ncbi:hypothetical protein BKA70DRAFT_1352380 [Coprinopsis sp. MPI-PUGE-AT-0042]|nr:hypothetical protein BKA70DRAFT_1352380 [Coprinopsis sp. MPI-PUGE-AT-0042]